MSQNKNKYFEVTTTKIVSAPNKTAAVEAAKRVRNSSVSVNQISAASAKAATA